MIKICKLIILFVTFFITKCVRLNPAFIIVHLDESEEAADDSPKIDKGIDFKNRQIVGLNKGKKQGEYCIQLPENEAGTCEQGLTCVWIPEFFEGICKRRGKNGTCTTTLDCQEDREFGDDWRVCKNGQCKLSSMCGIYSLCESCSENDCQDAGICTWMDGKCHGKKEGEYCGQCECLEPFTLGKCAEGLICVASARTDVADIPGTCKKPGKKQ